MLRYFNGYIFEGHTFVVNKSDIHNAKEEQFAEGTALMPDEWISVKDRLPDAQKWILGFCVSGAMEVVRYDSTTDDWDSVLPCHCYIKEYITHWMPLPEPPKGDDED